MELTRMRDIFITELITECREFLSFEVLLNSLYKSHIHCYYIHMSQQAYNFFILRLDTKAMILLGFSNLKALGL